MTDPNQERRPLGMVVDGSLTKGVEVRLAPASSVEDVKVGAFVTIQGERQRFFGVVTDIALGSASPSLKYSPPDVSDPFIAQVIAGTTAYGTISVLPTLILPTALGDDSDLKPAKTVPAHFSGVYPADERDVETVFGSDDREHFWIGSPLDMETKVCLDLKALSERSMGIFGKSGTGKTFLTRMLLIGMVQSGLASSLIFDMHNEYGWQGRSEGAGLVKGLKQLFPSKVAVFSLDEESSLRRGLSPDEVVRIGYDEVQPEDIEALQENLNLSEVAAHAAHNLRLKYGRGWLKEFTHLEGRDDLSELAASISVNVQALNSLYNRLARMKRYGFLTPSPGGRHDSVGRILEQLDRGIHVVLEFGRYGNDLNAYILVSNLLTRRIHERYVRLKEEAEGGQGKEPTPLVITIEEAHKFLSPSVAPQTIFGTIARELRKYNVTLMVIDQRPGAIDSEVMSQIGTKITCLLDNERDIDAVLGGAPGSRELRSVLSRLESRQQALIFGHAVPMPVVVHTREYGSAESYLMFGGDGVDLNSPRSDADLDDDLRDIFGNS